MTKVKSVKVKMAGVSPRFEGSAGKFNGAIVNELLASEDFDEILVERDEEELSAAVAEIESETIAKKAKPAKEKAVKAQRVTSVTHKPGDRLVALLGGDKSLLVLDSSKSEALQEQDTNEFIALMNTKGGIADKVKDKAIMLMTWLNSTKDASALNDVLRRAFTVLFAEGVLTSGKAGNLQENLLSKPYSLGTAASQSNQVFMLFPLLGIAVKEKGRLVLSEDSAIAGLVRAKLEL